MKVFSVRRSYPFFRSFFSFLAFFERFKNSLFELPKLGLFGIKGFISKFECFNGFSCELDAYCACSSCFPGHMFSYGRI